MGPAKPASQTGLLTVFIQHTSASLTIQENADPDVIADLNDFFERLAPEDNQLYRHTVEGPDDMPAHIRTALTQTQLSIPVIDGRLALGTWQGIYVFEHRRAGAPEIGHLALTGGVSARDPEAVNRAARTNVDPAAADRRGGIDFFRRGRSPPGPPTAPRL